MNRAGVTGIAQRIAARRTERKVGLLNLAKSVGITIPWARDLEADDSEVPMTLSLGQVCRLAESLSVAPRALVCGDVCPTTIAAVTPKTVVEAIKAHLSNNQLTVEQFGDAVGWDVQSVIGDASRIWPDWNLDQAHDVCEALGIDWRGLLPASIAD